MDLNLEPKPENPALKRKIAMGVSIASAVLILATLFTHGWLRAPDPFDAGFGLMSFKECQKDECRSMSNKELIDKHNKEVKEAKEEGYPSDAETVGPVFWLMGYATLLSSLLAAVSLVLAAVKVGQGQFMLKPFAPTTTAMIFLFLALVFACVFVATNPTRGENSIMGGQLGVGWGFWVFGIGTVAGIVAVPMLLKFKPVEPDPIY